VLDKGQEKDWFGDQMITTFAIISAIALVTFVIWEWRQSNPIVDIRLLKNRNFGTAVFLQFILGMVLFGTTVLIPQFSQGLLGYTAERAGMVLSPAGFVIMLLMPVSGRVVGKVKDARYLVALGYFLTGLGLLNLTRLDLDVSYGTLTFWRILQMVGLPFIFIPISTLNYVGVPANKNNQISSFSNFARNIGGSVGTATLTTFLIRNQQVHQSTMVANVISGSPSYQSYMARTTATFMAEGQSAATAAKMAMGYAYQQLGRQASMLSYQNAFGILGVIVLCLVPLPFIMRKPPRRAGPPPPAH
jgi:DHA2 family multidrug resistance protein